MLYGCFLWLLLPVCPLPSVPTAFGPTLGAAAHDSSRVVLWPLCASLSLPPRVPWVTSGATFQAPYFSPCFAFETQRYLINYHLVPVATSTERLKGTSPSRGTDLTFDSHCSFPNFPTLPTAPPAGCWQAPRACFQLLWIDLWSALTSFSHLVTSGSANPLGSTFKIYSESNHFSPPPLCPPNQSPLCLSPR